MSRLIIKRWKEDVMMWLRFTDYRLLRILISIVISLISAIISVWIYHFYSGLLRDYYFHIIIILIALICQIYLSSSARFVGKMEAYQYKRAMLMSFSLIVFVVYKLAPIIKV